MKKVEISEKAQRHMAKQGNEFYLILRQIGGG
jgi:hypothetical protein